jgi:DNA primase
MVANNDVEEIKQRLDIVEHISEYVQLKRSGANYKGVCPFHDEKTPSFMVSPEKQIFHCFGCGAGGDAIGFTMKYDGLSFPEALEALARKTGVELKRSKGQQRARGSKEALRATQSEALTFFTSHLEKAPVARKYLKDRGITGESIKRFSLGYSPPGWHNLEEHLRRKGHKPEIIRKSGLVAEGQKGSYDIFRGRIMFPILDISGQVIAFGGRVMDNSEPKYLNSPDTELFRKGDNLYALNLAREGIKKDGYAIVVEGYMDAIMCHQHGLSSAVAPLGTALTPGHIKKLRRYSEKVVLLFDGDRAGIAAARRSLDLIMTEAMNARVLVLPEGQDPDSILNDKGESFMRKIIDEKTLSPVEFVLRHSPGDTAVRESAEMIAKATDPLMRDQLILELSDLSRISESAIREKLRLLSTKPYGTQQRGQQAGAVRKRPSLKAYNEEVLLLSAAIASPGHCPSILENVSLEDIEDPVVMSLLKKLSAGDASREGVLALAETDEENELVTRLSVSPGFEIEHIDENIQDCIIKISKRRLDQRIISAQSAGDMKLLQQLVLERQNLIKREQA